MNLSSLNSYLDIIDTNVRQCVYKIELLRQEDETPYKSIQDILIDNSGTITNTFNDGIRRTASFECKNNGKYNDFVEYIKNMTIGSKFKLYLGYLNDMNDPILFPQGVYIFDNPSMTNSDSSHTISLSGTDKWSMLNGQNGGVLGSTLTIDTGAFLGDIIMQTLRLEIVNDPIIPYIDSSIYYTETTYDISKNTGDTVADIFLELALNTSCYIYYDENGVLNVRPFEYDFYKQSIYRFKNKDTNTISTNTTINLDKIYNSVVVVADNNQNNNIPIVVKRNNENPSDPNSVQNLGYEKIKIITDYTKGIITEALGIERANWELKKSMMKQVTVNVSCLPLYHLDVDNVIELPVENLDTKRYVISSIVHNIGTVLSSSLNVYTAQEEVL